MMQLIAKPKVEHFTVPDRFLICAMLVFCDQSDVKVISFVPLSRSWKRPQKTALQEENNSRVKPSSCWKKKTQIRWFRSQKKPQIFFVREDWKGFVKNYLTSSACLTFKLKTDTDGPGLFMHYMWIWYDSHKNVTSADLMI